MYRWFLLSFVDWKRLLASFIVLQILFVLLGGKESYGLRGIWQVEVLSQWLRCYADSFLSVFDIIMIILLQIEQKTFSHILLHDDYYWPQLLILVLILNPKRDFIFDLQFAFNTSPPLSILLQKYTICNFFSFYGIIYLCNVYLFC